jgi:polysaccharide deacetylase family protein (PEP-CTERM system associated)
MYSTAILMPPSILITIDVEDWFQVENFKSCIPFSTWEQHGLRVEKNVHRLLDLFDSCNEQRTINNGPTKNSLKATFFVLGWIAKRLPNLVQEIQARGHEVASHGFNHNLCIGESCQSLEQDLLDSKKLLEDTISAPVRGFRAPSFSICNDIVKIIEDCGYLYDSSFNSFAMHGRYGKLLVKDDTKKGVSYQVSNNFFELPISNLTLGKKGFVLPWGGGAYFRIIPFSIFKRGVESILKKEDAYVFYMHPWEIDPDQPRVGNASSSCKFKHYINIKKTFLKLTRFIEYFGQCRFVSCRQYLDKII